MCFAPVFRTTVDALQPPCESREATPPEAGCPDRLPHAVGTGDSLYEDGMKKLYVGNLSPDASESEVRDLFSQFGTVRSISVAVDVFSRKCRGFGFIEMEGHEARAAIAGLNGKTFKDRPLKVNEERPREQRGRRR